MAMRLGQMPGEKVAEATIGRLCLMMDLLELVNL